MGGGSLVVSVESRGHLVNVEGILNLLWEPVLLPHQDLGVIQCVVMTGGRGVFHNCRVEVFSICVFSEPGAPHSDCLTNVFLVTFTTLNAVTKTLLLYGNNELSVGENKCIFDDMHKFRLSCKFE